jgi:hypothetical protein
MGFFMAIYYKNSDKLEALAKKTGSTNPVNRMSDLMDALYGGRGGNYDELKYWRKINTDATAVNAKDSDAVTKFARGKSVVGSRADQLERDLWHKNNL